MSCKPCLACSWNTGKVSSVIHRHDDREARDINGQTPIMRAIACGHESVVKAMFIFGYQINNNVKQHKTLLKWAIENDYSVLIMV